MSLRLVNVDRNTPLLLPPDLREWVAKDDLAHFVLEAVESLNCSGAVLNQRGSGSRQYPPAMMLSLLIYCYASGMFSSRQIEKATYQHLSVRYLSANTHPDHDTIAKFRRENGRLIEDAFVHVLELAKELEMTHLGTICIDGTKIRAATSKRATLTAQQIEEELTQLKSQVRECMAAADEADRQPEPDGQRLPQSLVESQQRQAKLEAAQRVLQQRAQQRAAQRQAERQQHKDGPGEPPRPLPPTPRPKDTVNTTDADSGLMPTAKEGFVQGYNAQLAVSVKRGLIIGAQVSQETNDRRQLLPTLAAIPSVLGKPQAVLIDSGYDNQRQIAEVERSGTCVYCPPQRSHKPGKAARTTRQRLLTQQARQRMSERLASPEGRELYRLRGQVIEPVIGIIKSALGFRSFRLRGLCRVNLEWKLVSLAFNCKRLAMS